jgi:AraC-like DNA-binding protein
MGALHTIRLTVYERHQVAAAKDYIDQHLHEVLNLCALACQWDLSPYKLKAGIEQLTGVSFTAYLQEQRLQKAKELLLTTNRILYDIARACGYRNVSAFVRAFRRRFGTTPGAFRME